MGTYISLSQAFRQWQELAADIPRDDGPMLAESWNDYTDSLCKDGEICALQYEHAPAWDEPMPGEGSRFDPLADDRAFILDRMGVTLSAVFVPFSQSRNKNEKSPSLNWRVTLRYGGRDVIETDYSQGAAHCPAYNKPIKFSDGKIDRWATNRAIETECETGRRTVAINNGSGYFSVSKARISPPHVVDVFYSLLLDASALDAGGFPEWCADMGMDDDSISARKMYDACIETAVKLRAAFGEKTLSDLRDLFQEM